MFDNLIGEINAQYTFEESKARESRAVPSPRVMVIFHVDDLAALRELVLNYRPIEVVTVSDTYRKEVA